MIQTRSLILALLFSTIALADINTDFDHILSGKQPVSTEVVDSMFRQFMTEYKLQMKYSPADKFRATGVDRKAVFANKVAEIIKHNSDPNTAFKKGINAFSDMTESEFFDYYNLVNAEQKCSATTPRSELSKRLENIPDNFDWRDKGIVSPVKNQGSCGSCWTFSTVGCLESHYLKKYGQFRNLSEQQLVDCAGDFDNHGCNGGLPSHAFEYIMYAGGIAEEKSYPYTAKTNNCSLDQNTLSVGVIGGSVNISLSEDDLKQALFVNGPISVAF